MRERETKAVIVNYGNNVFDYVVAATLVATIDISVVVAPTIATRVAHAPTPSLTRSSPRRPYAFGNSSPRKTCPFNSSSILLATDHQHR